MQLNTEIVNTAPRDAATVMMLRDTLHGLEVFMLRRHDKSAVLGGAYVFPGGKLDPEDAAMAQWLDRSAGELHQSLGEEQLAQEKAAGLYVAALREAYEESGVLIGLGASAEQSATVQTLALQGSSFQTVVSSLGLRLDTTRLQPWSRWITPRQPTVSKQRFDSRFFVAAVPQHQSPRHDNVEATHSMWLTPRVVLQEYWADRITLAAPQIMTLAHLARYATVDEVLREAKLRKPPLIQPEPYEMDGKRVHTYPGDPLHTQPDRSMPGPTRLYIRNQRFEPEGGLQAFFN